MAWRLSIDFGTSNTAAAIDAHGRVSPIALADGALSMPSAIVLTPSGFRVGQEAINAQLRHPDGFERTPKALIGRGEVVLGGKIVEPREIAREVYGYVREAALRRQDNQEPAEVWLTHPVAWAPSQIETLREAAVEAGFKPEAIRTVNEPIAAAAHFARNHQAAPGARVAVFDFGGGTLDIAVLERAPQEPQGFKVLAFGGDPVLGGRTFDARLLDWTLDTLSSRGHEELTKRLHQPKTMSELRAQTSLSRAVTAAKTELSTRADADISVSLGEEDAVVTITRQEYERLIRDDLDRAAKLLNDVFETVQGPAPQVLYLTGGSSRTPSISAMIRERTGIRIATLDDPKLVTAEGALYVSPLGAKGVRASATPRPGAQSPQRPNMRPAPAPFGGAPGRPPMPGPGGPSQPNSPQTGMHQRPPMAQPPAAGPLTRNLSRPNQTGPGPRPPQATTSASQYRPTPPQGMERQQPQPPQQDRSAPTTNEQRHTPPQGMNRQPQPGTAPAHEHRQTPPQGMNRQPTPQPFASSQPRPAEAPKKKRTGMIIALILAALLLVGGGVWGGIMLFNQNRVEGAKDGDRPLPEVESGTIDCWDGSSAKDGNSCPALTGQRGLDWIVPTDGASCTKASLEMKNARECTWYDHKDTHFYILEFESYDQALEYGENSYDDSGAVWDLDGEETGTKYEGEFSEGTGGYSQYFVYEGLPYGIFVRFDKDSSGNTGEYSDIESRVHPRSWDEVAYAVASSER